MSCKTALCCLGPVIWLIVALGVPGGEGGAQTHPIGDVNVAHSEREARTIACTAYPAVPARLSRRLAHRCLAQQEDDVIKLANGYLDAEIPLTTGVIRVVKNKITGQSFTLSHDQTGFVAKTRQGQSLQWMAGPNGAHSFDVTIADRPEAACVMLTETVGDVAVTITYRIRRDQFWVERDVAVQGGQDSLKFDRLVYGRLEAGAGPARVLQLGKFDRPRLVTLVDGGLFGGVGWWFYSVDDQGVYQNTEMDYTARGRFMSAPWYLGVFGVEAGEPFSGWLWYKSFLRIRKVAYDKHPSWSSWNAGWGQWGIEIDDPSAQPYIDLARRIGVRGMLFGGGGSGKGVPAYVQLARDSKAARENLAKLKENGTVFGCLENGNLNERWADAKVLNAKMTLLGEFVGEGLSAYHFDFFSTIDTFTAHRRAADYFKAAHDELDYTECHLGMATYGPQFQREVLINHPTDLHGFDISRFSSDWATFLGFRHSRAEWQRRYQYLMPEYGLYYFLTHYSNWGHPRRYTDPEPQQFLYGPHAYCGLGYNFHDTIGFREVFAAASAFTPYLVLGHLDLKMPERDLAFARKYMKWIAENVDVLRPGRVCWEDDGVCVVSKLREGKGAVFVLNYSPGEKTIRLKLKTGVARPLEIRPVYPTRDDSFTAEEGETIGVMVRGESLAILEVNGAFHGLPPENPSAFPIDLKDWRKTADGWKATVVVPDVRDELAESTDPSLPDRLVSLDQLQLDVPEQVDRVRVGPGQEPKPVIRWLGRGKLPGSFLKAYGFADDKFVETWKIVPWAYADRLWLVYRPGRPPPLGDGDDLPTARVNDQTVPMYPRVDYRPGKPEAWTCPLFYADVTKACQYGGQNSLVLSGLNEEEPSCCYLVSGADRK